MSKDEEDKANGCGCLIFILIAIVYLISSCGKEDSNYETSKEEFQTDKVEIVTAVQLGIQDAEMISNVDWPWESEEYNITEVGDDTYKSTGQFSHNGYKYNFNVTVRFNDNKTYSILNCDVYR